MPISKHLFKGINSDISEKDVPEGYYLDALNLVPPAGGGMESIRRESYPGTVLTDGTLSSGSNRCVGVCADRNRKRIIFFNHNSLGKHAIYSLDMTTRKYSNIMTWAGFNFDPSRPVSATIVEDKLYFTDGESEIRMIDLDFAVKVGYGTPTDDMLSYLKIPPRSIITFVKVVASGIKRNLIAEKNFQFTYRFTYTDNSKSVFAPLSKLAQASLLPSSSAANGWRITYVVDPSLQPLIKEVELAYRENNTGNYKVFHIEKSHKPGTNTYDFTATENIITVPMTESSKLFEPIYISKALAHFKNFNFKANSKAGFTIKEKMNLTVSLTSTSLGDRTLKYGGVYEAGLVFYDKKLRNSGVVASQRFDVTERSTTLKDGFIGDVLYKARVTIKGKVPSRAKYCSVVLSKEKTQLVYAQVPANFMFYVGDIPDLPEGEVYPIPSNQIVHNGKIYLKNRPNGDTGYSFVHLQLPDNIGFLPDTDCYVKLLTSPTQRTEPVLDVLEDGKTVVIKNFDIGNFGVYTHLLVEVYKKKKVNEEFFYEVGNLIPVNPGETITKVVDIEGDAFRISTAHKDTSFKFYRKTDQLGYDLQNNLSPYVLSPTPTFGTNISNATTEVLPDVTGFEFKKSGGFRFVGINFNQKVDIIPLLGKTKINTSFTLDYDKIAADYGRPFVMLDNEREVTETTTIDYSDSYAQGSQINGLNTYGITNSYALPVGSSPITKIVEAHDRLIFVHEKNVTSVFIGEGFIRQGNDAILAKTEGVIGDDRTMRGGLGSTLPESIVADAENGRVYGVDLYAGEPWRYSLDGVTPLAWTYGISNYFRDKCKRYRDSVSEPRVYTGLDPDRGLVFFTFDTFTYKGQTEIGETVVFSEKDKAWIGKVSMVGEYYAHLDSVMVAFWKGRPYVCGEGEVNNFFGARYDSRITLVSNLDGDYDKSFESIALDSSKPFAVTITNSNGQKTTLQENHFRIKDSTWYSAILRDINTKMELIPEGSIPLRDGRPIVSKTCKIEITYSGNDKINLDAVYVGYSIASGHLLKRF